MSVQDFVDAIVTFVRANEGWTAPIAFAVAFLESFCFLSILWPGTAILIGISALLARSGVELSVLWPAIVAAGLGGSLGYALSYWIGLYYKDGIRELWPFNRNPEMVNRGQAFFNKWGALGVFFGHFFSTSPSSRFSTTLRSPGARLIAAGPSSSISARDAVSESRIDRNSAGVGACGRADRPEVTGVSVGVYVVCCSWT